MVFIEQFKFSVAMGRLETNINAVVCLREIRNSCFKHEINDKLWTVWWDGRSVHYLPIYNHFNRHVGVRLQSIVGVPCCPRVPLKIDLIVGMGSRSVLENQT